MLIKFPWFRCTSWWWFDGWPLSCWYGSCVSIFLWSRMFCGTFPVLTTFRPRICAFLFRWDLGVLSLNHRDLLVFYRPTICFIFLGVKTWTYIPTEAHRPQHFLSLQPSSFRFPQWQENRGSLLASWLLRCWMLGVWFWFRLLWSLRDVHWSK